MADVLIPLSTTSSKVVRFKKMKNFIHQLEQGMFQSRPGRSFPRRSRKPINRWQKSIAKEHERRKRHAMKGPPP